MTGEEVLAPVSETETLRQQLLQAQRLSSVGELASSIAHEFNNILTTIINSAKLGLRNPDSGREAAGVRADREGRVSGPRPSSAACSASPARAARTARSATSPGWSRKC